MRYTMERRRGEALRFDGLLGNDALRARLSAEAAAGKLSHCYRLVGQEGSGKRTLARLLAAAALCTGEKPPCLSCRDCKKVLSGVHPDIITVDDPEKKIVPVDAVRAARSELFIRPNEGRRKILIFPRAQDLNASGQNALLKILEEPPDYGMFLLLTPSSERLLPTIRSRSAELRLSPLPDGLLRSELLRRFPAAGPDALDAAVSRSGGFLGQAAALLETEPPPQVAAFAEAWSKKDTLALLSLFCSMEKLKREQLSPVLEGLRRLTADALLAREGVPPASARARTVAGSHSPQKLLAAAALFEAALADVRANVNTATICAALFAQLK